MPSIPRPIFCYFLRHHCLKWNEYSFLFRFSKSIRMRVGITYSRRTWPASGIYRADGPAADANTWPFHRLLGATVGLFDPAIERENFLPDTSLIRRTRGEKPVDQQHLASPIATWADRTINLGVQSVTRLARFTIWPALALPQWSSFLEKKVRMDVSTGALGRAP